MRTHIAALYVHGPQPTRPTDETQVPMIPIESTEAVVGMGLRNDARYFRRPPQARERKRQVSLIDEGTIWRLEGQFGPIPREDIKAQIILAGDLHLPDLIGTTLEFSGGASLQIAMPRKPCFAMDLITPGLREAMEGGQQGALAMVTVGGRITVGDAGVIADAQAEGAAREVAGLTSS